MSKLFYRFRSIDNLVGEEYHELESQTIYFAHPKQLNDPMEGYRDVYWQGDIIVWKNLFRHYLLCLERLCSLLAIAGETHTMSENDIPVFLSEAELPTSEYKTLFLEITSTFFSNQYLLPLIKGISERSSPIRRDELFIYLRTVHPIALEAIYKTYNKYGLASYQESPSIKADMGLSELLKSNWFEVMERSLKENHHLEDLSSTIFFAQKQILLELDIINRYNRNNDSDYKNRTLVNTEFPERYISKIEQLIYPEWYVACFMSDYRNASVWGHYGNNHSGACLIFKADTNGEDFSLNLETITGGSWDKTRGFSPSRGFVSHKFEKVDYIKGFGEVDFFRFLGRLPIPQLNATWYLAEGKMSTCAEDMLSDEDAWRKRYWADFQRDILVKTKDWEYEKEYRIILSSGLNSFDDKNERLLKYDFNSLAGIIFGIRTSTEDKLKVMKVIEHKCKELDRKDFKFYQASYSAKEKSIVSREMGLLKV